MLLDIDLGLYKSLDKWGMHDLSSYLLPYENENNPIRRWKSLQKVII